MPEDAPLILLPGMGADERMFRAQRAAFPALRVPGWIPPLRREPLAHYARRLAAAVDPGVPCFVGGASFGGMVALEMAPHLRALAVFLIGSMRGPAGLHPCLRATRPLAALTLALPFGLLGPLAAVTLSCSGRFLSRSACGLLRHVSRADGEFLRWGTWAALRWRPSPAALRGTVYQIHGAHDRVLPARRAPADLILPEAGHLLSMTHGPAVNSFIAARVRPPLGAQP
jgi:pimeloyl-ACP methyl ester carboxylesterase